MKKMKAKFRPDLDDQVFQDIADGVKLILCAICFAVCILMLAGSVLFTEAEISAIRQAILGF